MWDKQKKENLNLGTTSQIIKDLVLFEKYRYVLLFRDLMFLQEIYIYLMPFGIYHTIKKNSKPGGVGVTKAHFSQIPISRSSFMFSPFERKNCNSNMHCQSKSSILEEWQQTPQAKPKKKLTIGA